MNLRKVITLPALLLTLFAQAKSQSNYVLGVQHGNVGPLAENYNLTVVNDLSGGSGPYLVTPPAGSDPLAVASDPSVLSYEPDSSAWSSESNTSAQTAAVVSQLANSLAASSLVSFYGTMVRSAYVQQTASTMLELPAAQQIATGAGIVAVIDTGVDPFHPALAGVLVSGYDFTRNQATIPNEMQDLDPTPLSAVTYSSLVPQSSKTEGFQLQGSTVVILDGSTVAILDGTSLPVAFGHGTMTAGLIHLVAPTASIMPLKAFRSDGTANLSDIVRAIYFAVDHGAQVINMSFDIQTESPQLQNAIAYATNHGVVCVAAAGNEGEMEVTYPAGLPGVFGIGSVDDSGQRSLFSNYGTASVFMAAPGEALITPFPGGNYAGVWGTSFSAALVSGAVSSLLQVNPRLNCRQAARALSAGPAIPGQQLGQDQLDVLSSLQALLQK